MGIKITYSDETTSDILAERTISDVEMKALGWQMISRTGNGKVVFLDFLDNAVRHLARKRANEICEIALNDKTDTILTAQDKQQLRGYLNANNIVLMTPAQLPWNIKKLIVERANIKSAAERNAEAEAEMGK